MRVLLAAIAVFGLVGCTTSPFSTFKQSYRSVTDANNETVGSIFIWSNDVNAAVIYKSGVVCAQRAMTVMTADSRIDASVSDSILKLSEAVAAKAQASAVTAAAAAQNPAGPAAGAQASSQASQDAALVELAASIQEAAQLLTTTTERTAFLDVGMFYLCQLANNRSITEDAARSLTALLIQEAGGLNQSPASPRAQDVATAPVVAGPAAPVAPAPVLRQPRQN